MVRLCDFAFQQPFITLDLSIMGNRVRGEGRQQTLTEGASELTENELSRHIVDAAIEVHRTLGGPGLLESVYLEALAFELQARGLPVQRQVRLPIAYKGTRLRKALRIDLLIGGKVIVECKAAAIHNPLFEAQVLTYLRLSGRKLGMVINFGQPAVSRGIRRVVNGL